MMINKKIIYFFIALMAFCSCNRYDLDEILLSKDDISLTWKGEVQIVYEPLSWQLSCNAKNNEFRVNDDDMANYFVFRSDARPAAADQELEASIEWTLKNNIKRYEALKFEVQKVEGAKVWLWNRSQKIGLTIMYID